MAGIYGLKIKDSSGNVVYITPETASLISAGSPYVPTILRPDNTFGINIKLPGIATFDEASIGVIANVRAWNSSTAYAEIQDSEAAQQWFYMKFLNSANTYYEYDKTNGQMTVFTPEVVGGIPKDTVYSQHGIVFWDKGSTEQAGSQFDTVRIFPALACYIYDASALSFKIVYTLGKLGKIDYAVFLKNLNG
jgi:hypothetical protein